MQEGEEIEPKIILEMQCSSTEKKESKGFPIRSIFGIIKTGTEMIYLLLDFWKTKSRDLISVFHPLL